MRLNSPVSNRKRHGIPHQNDRRHRVAAQLAVAVDEVVDAEGDAARVAEGQGAHGHQQPEPVHAVGGADPPQNQGRGDDDDAGGEGPQALLGFHDAAVVPGELDREPVAEAAGEEGAADVHQLELVVWTVEILGNLEERNVERELTLLLLLGGKRCS